MTDPRIAALTKAVATALVDLEEERHDPACMADECDHADGECPEPVIGCGDAGRIAAAILAGLPPDWCGHIPPFNYVRATTVEALAFKVAEQHDEIARLRPIEEAARGVYNCCYWTETCREHDALRAALEEKP